MKKRHSAHHLFWLGLRVVLGLSATFCVLSFLRIQSEYKPEPPFTWTQLPFTGPPKIAFLFLVRANLPLDFLWNHFFLNGDSRNFSIYIHSKPGFVLDESTTRCTFCYGRQLSQSIQVGWGEATMIKAERILIQKALQDPANQRFVLLSESCVPLYNFSYIYNYLLASPKSFVDSFLDTKEGRYNPKMSSVIPKDRWKKGSQWITLIRKHAELVVTDDRIFPVFERYCKRRPPSDELEEKVSRSFLFSFHKPNVQKEHNCIPDEHYVQTLLAMRDLEDEVERRTLTYTSWNQSTTETEKQAWHPLTFGYRNADSHRIKEIKKMKMSFLWSLLVLRTI
ncbi:uncharacterized protein LOC18428747 isoform X2 [Amborella trichopoda]|uniref:uncharacterized protein LOC18428747 isoform X2 n=1 Tax=Amborella trichopoda TaxID=13333 RepID=UPI0009BECFA7|nr:uncharacterized protein LOC18428747 isoform X2 [Amborella trichopoda]|eukprot:XP_020519581.1 uncharacterized protein LOC18428747 isoform X2 [Amborella trichopoda]